MKLLYSSGTHALDKVLQNQASIISYINDFKLMMLMWLAAIPLLLRGAQSRDADGRGITPHANCSPALPSFTWHHKRGEVVHAKELATSA